jgi:hypothetical protein
VSPLWRDQVNILLAPDSVQVAQFGRGWSPRARWSRSLPCPPQSNGWQPALDTLEGILALQPWHGAGARVVVSNHFAHYALVPDAAHLRDAAERMAAARHLMHATYGEESGAWRIAAGQAHSQGALLAAAIETPFLEGIQAVLTKANLQPLSVEPLVVRAFNQCRQRIAREAAWLVVAEPGRVSLGYLHRGAWILHRVERIRASIDEALLPLLERCRLIDGDATRSGRVIFVSREPARVELPRGEWSIDRFVLDGFGARS